MKKDNKNSVRQLVSLILNTEVDEKEREEIIHLLIKKRTSETPSSYTRAQRIADRFSRIAGSWGFIISFCVVMLIWILVNVYFISNPFDPYPFILLNLALSCVAAIQAPVILMSQNRQEEKDRERAENDYKVNLKAEIILEDLHHKIDLLIAGQHNIKEKLRKESDQK